MIVRAPLLILLSAMAGLVAAVDWVVDPIHPHIHYCESPADFVEGTHAMMMVSSECGKCAVAVMVNPESTMVAIESTEPILGGELTEDMTRKILLFRHKFSTETEAKVDRWSTKLMDHELFRYEGDAAGFMSSVLKEGRLSLGTDAGIHRFDLTGCASYRDRLAAAAKGK